MITNANQIVISFNDHGPEEVCAIGTTMVEALYRCEQLREEYCAKHDTGAADIHFHINDVRVWDPSK